MNNENIYINKDENKTQETVQQKPWTKRVFNWMYSETPKSLEIVDENAMISPIDQEDEDLEEEDDLMNDVPKITINVNSPSSLDASTEFSSTR